MDGYDDADDPPIPLLEPTCVCMDGYDQQRLNIFMRTYINLIEAAQHDEIEESSASRIITNIRKGVEFFMISGMRGHLNRRDNNKRDQRLRHILNHMPVSYITTEGEYWEAGANAPSPESSYFVMGYDKVLGRIPIEQLRRIAVKLMMQFDQDSVLLGDGKDILLIENDGSEMKVGNHMTFDPAKIDKLPGFSKVKSHKFSFGDVDTPVAYGMA